MFKFLSSKNTQKAPVLPCEVCGYLTISKRGIHQVCPVCYWEDADPALMEEANEVPLHNAQENFAKFGAVQERLLAFARPPRPDEVPSAYNEAREIGARQEQARNKLGIAKDKRSIYQ